MCINSKKILSCVKLNLFSVAVVFCLLCSSIAFSQPVNDNCQNASVVTISNSGFGLGVFTSTTDSLASATVQNGETFAPAILVGGLFRKSIWYKFILPTNRSVKVNLSQPSAVIGANDAGFTIYKTNTCLPANPDISTKLTPHAGFDSTFNPCVDAGDYLIQVSADSIANGPVYIKITLGQPTAAFDQQSQAYNFGTILRGITAQPNFSIDCQSIEDAGEVCNTLGNFQDYNKSTWHVFKTPAYLDYLAILLAANNPGKMGIKVYQGDVRSTPYSSLPVVSNCDSLMPDNLYVNPSTKIFDCNQLNPNTTYSIQIFYNKNYTGQIALSLGLGGIGPTIAPEPILSAITPTTNNLGVLPSSPSGVLTQRNDCLACNSRHAIHPCSPSLPAGGVIYGGHKYNMSSFFIFTLSGTSNVDFNISNYSALGSCGPPLMLRVYNQNVSNSCSSLDIANIIGQFLETGPYPTTGSFSCLPAGNYTMQILGRDSAIDGLFYCNRSNLGTIFDLNITVKSVAASNKFSLSAPGVFDTLNNISNVMQPLVSGTLYTSKTDTFGCANTVMPLDANCNAVYTKAIYREFVVPDSGIVSLFNVGPDLNYKLYSGDANSLAIAQNAFSFPATISGLTPQTICMNTLRIGECDGTKVCVLPGTYTEAVFGNTNQIGVSNQLKVRYNPLNTVHYNLATAEDMGDILSIIPAAGGSVTSNTDYYSCKDNAIVIDGFQPCNAGLGSTGTKAIYRQFYLSSPANITINSLPFGCDYTPVTLFKGKATDGVSALTVMPAPWRCFTAIGLNVCDVLPAGWYTVVSYGWGPSYQNPMRDVNVNYAGNPQYSSMVGFGNKIQITVTVPPCAAPKYNRPYKAAIDPNTNQPFLIQWGPRAGHTAAYPRTDTMYTLPTENFNCVNDTPFVTHPIQNCIPGLTKVAYWVFRTTQESFIRINTEFPLGGGYNFDAYWIAVYPGNARTDSASFATAQLIQPCIRSVGQVQICKLQPGDYTLVVFTDERAYCRTLTPSIYIDAVGYSRFDHANNAYDFGLIPPDSLYHDGKAGDVNPLNPGRTPSNDFFYCTTGSQSDDPGPACRVEYLASINLPGVNNPTYAVSGTSYEVMPRRNLWYTFTIDKGGIVRVKVKPKTPSRGTYPIYSVWKSDVNGTLPFSTVVSSGGVDSTITQGLTLVAFNVLPYPVTGHICEGLEDLTFTRESCSPIPERYYIIVENRCVETSGSNPGVWSTWAMTPNHQIEVSVLFDSVNAILPQFDHYYQANNIGTNLGPGIYNGATDNFSCATRDGTDPTGFNPSYETVNCTKTIWYKFSTTVSGVIKPYVVINGAINIDPSTIQLYRQIIPGDSTANGLQILDFYGGSWQCCITPGSYYILLPNCNLTSGYEFPVIELTESAGDYCSRPVIASLNGAGSFVASALINCHTIGTDYGEFNPTLTCPDGAITNQYKTSWFKINIIGTDTLDLTTFLSQNTTATSSQIKYRLMNGDCGAMQERSCVQDALTQDTYKCLPPGDYWVQVFSPANAIGTIDLHISAVHHADTCAPINQCLSNAHFQKQFDCTTSSAVQFINYSAFGSSVSYLWNFGYNGQTSTATAPQFFYPALTTSQTYYITLTVRNNSCNPVGQSIYTDSITIPPRPGVNLGTDTSLCNGGTLLLNATSYPGSTYLWNNGSTNPTLTAVSPGQNNYSVTVTYNGCIARDTIRVNIDPVSPLTQYKYICGANTVQLNSARGLGESYSWNTGATTASITVFTPGIYWNDMNLNGCITRDSFIVSAAVYSLGNDREVCFGGQPIVLNATTPGAAGYIWQNGSTGATFSATTAGLYWVDVSFGNCSLRDTIILSNIQPVLSNLAATICQGQSYTLPSGSIINAAGIYSDTVRTSRGCDSLINSINLAVQSSATVNMSAAICPGQTYTLPWGTIVSATGVYRDTLRYTTGCDSIRRTVNLVVQTATSQTTAPVICSGQTYTLPWGTIINVTGVYRDTLHYTTGCDSIWRTVNLTVQSPASQTLNPVICAGSNYTLPWGTVVNTSGIYRDTLHYTTGCDSIRRTVNLIVQSAISVTVNPVICAGQAYTLPWGTVVNATGVYRDTLHYTTGCDSVKRTVNLTVEAPVAVITNPTICVGQSYTLPWGTIVNTPGIYMDTLHSVAGCDSVRRTVNLTILTATAQTFNPVICSGQTYILPWGAVVNTAGIYMDTLHGVFGCDSVRRTVNLTVQSATSVTVNPVICAGQAYTLPWGTVVNTTGVYRDTLHYTTGCDSVRRTVNLMVETPLSIISNPTICVGQSYTLPWGTIVNSPGVYADTLHSVAGCDSVRKTVNLTILTATAQTFNPVICEGSSYTLPWGTVVNTDGIYMDTLHGVFGCDSVRRTVNLTVQSSALQTTNPIICAGQTYTLPWGAVVNTAGVYRDTLHYSTGCDSVRRIVNLTIETPVTIISNPTICAGQSYTLPWGIVVNTPGVYYDTLHYTAGCDSVRRTVNLTILTASDQFFNPVICDGSTYSLPWGTIVNTTGTYRDTLQSVFGCDSIRRTVNLTVQIPASQTFNPAICSGQTFTLPWGTIINTAGVYRDTLHFITGCDSIRRTVNLTVQAATVQTFNPIVCNGTTYTLPWGTVVSTAGIYYDTLHYTTGCDSVRRTVNLTVQSSSSQTINPVICQGSTYTLPWGTIVNTSGVYHDTLHYATGCDSIRRTVNLTVQSPALQNYNPVICAGSTYTLPWGAVVNATGIYRDTLHYTTGCDSVRRIVSLIIQSPASVTANPIICAGQTYMLPWGTVVNTAGTYRDTLHYLTGCDSIRRTVNLAIQTFTSTASSAIICAGQTYLLPWGTVVNTSGVYRDTLHYTTGCDSIRRVFNLTVQSAASVTTNPVICQGATYTLPWGTVVNTAGIYRDTLHYITGCDSVRRTVNLQVTAAVVSTTAATICSDETYTLPWGTVTNIAGIYKDTVRTRFGCDSLIRTVNLRVDPAPSVLISKSNDINCLLSITNLRANGGISYTWTPSVSLSNPNIYNPVASPSATTWYKVLVTSDKGCTTEDSIQVIIIPGNTADGYLVPNAFTPNGDGKNDCFGVQTWGSVTNFEFSVFSRWGERVFYTKNPGQCWDGTYKGKEQSANVFVYQIKAKGLCGDIFRTGTVTLIR